MDSAGTRTNETKYERIRKIGIGSYGVVFKCANRQTGQIVAIKRYSENDSDPIIRKIAMREVRMLRQLKHPNLIQLLEVFRRKRILHLVFDYCELTVLDVIEKYANNCPLNLIRKIIWQLVNGVSHCHSHNCIHRDIKPENILINQAGIVKLCDFGFARSLNTSNASSLSAASVTSRIGRRESDPQQRATAAAGGDVNKENFELVADRQALTEYVATRWYRAPELLVGDIYYDFKIDIWAIGCVAAELMRGEPLWPAKTDLEQLCIIRASLGQLTQDQTHNLLTRGLYEQSKIERLLSQSDAVDPLDRKLPTRVSPLGVEFVLACLQMDPLRRPTSDELLKHDYIHSALMGQFVNGSAAANHNNASGALSRPNADGGSEQMARHQNKANIGHGLLVRHAVPVPVNGQGRASAALTVLRSNSQAILKAAATAGSQQQPATKRLVMRPDSSSGDNFTRRHYAGGGGGGGGGGGARPSNVSGQREPGQQVATDRSMGTRVGRQTATTSDENNYKVRQSRHKPRKVPRSQSQAVQRQASVAAILDTGLLKDQTLDRGGGGGGCESGARSGPGGANLPPGLRTRTDSKLLSSRRLNETKLVTTSKRTRKLPAGGCGSALIVSNVADQLAATSNTTPNSTVSSVSSSNSMSLNYKPPTTATTTTRLNKSLTGHFLPPVIGSVSSKATPVAVLMTREV